jgi:threonylcarbamoyladenosine tRNA methylthiotransferase MtaB
MGRPYKPSDYAAIVTRLKAADSGWCIGADVIVGFPGETDVEFEETCDFIESIPLSYLHVFTFSERPGTRASKMSGQVPQPVRDDRNKVLKDLSRKKRRMFAETQRGVELEFIIENKRDSLTGKLIGLSDNYLRVLFDGPDNLHRAFIEGMLMGFSPGRETGLGILNMPACNPLDNNGSNLG